jgi:uncharacterized membrane-anchored protein YjiN (DUF445 family)
MTVPAALSLPHSEHAQAAKRRQLAVSKRQATALLGGVALVWLAVTVFGGGAGWTAYVQAAAGASMVGGLADWFAVTALFRHPLGLPIPHTAVVVERKDSFGAALGAFIQQSFLTPDTLVERVRAAAVVPRVSAWLADPDRASRAAGHLAGVGAELAGQVDVGTVRRAAADLFGHRLADLDLAPLAAGALRTVVLDPAGPDLVGPALAGASTFVREHREELRGQLTRESPWWLPGPLEERIVGHLLDGAARTLGEMAADPEHPLRLELTERLADLATALETSPALRAQGERLKAAVLSRPELTEWVGPVWDDLNGQLRRAAGDPGSALRHRLAAAVSAAGRRLRDDPHLAATAEDRLEAGVRSITARFGRESASLVSQTIARWDTEETARRLELLLGPDLQYIRINGTVVGAGAGLVIFTVGRLLVR